MGVCVKDLGPDSQTPGASYNPGGGPFCVPGRIFQARQGIKTTHARVRNSIQR